ncbi:MAG: hypothetical protein A3E98_01920 [Candidatus Doudnabacteria bacterium RIFCSPHIGHO2_12_FULL_48_11]|uniref:Metallo-beta-lactamase domain-containing protein n=1 Tax=Candidatus Doudnabacteria bacterium RIFCSPHIGHO2_01_FULL_46_24 TaxID=1817825 RepID=A0A1F5NW16_9BACT|nr:MAG: hypothetical protein A2720_02235 [Candidatus Doudnabacteria bacterium RIFCSPHIGHO2_01_FULL_46_24]OGE95548.1 MAG: hypothetical protein A3E98_01920 [Candidatus Doudnabacteria bacterium RIFCSPHIGHO2_12_FULL_48_11]
MNSQTTKIIQWFLVPLLFLNLAAWVAFSKSRPDFLLHVDFLDVGQGDSIFIQTFQGNQIVIDGGPSDQVLGELGKVMPFYDRTIDLLILTHPDLDHVAGFTDVLKRYRVKKVLLTGVSADTAAYKQFAEALEKEKAEKIYAQVGQRVWLDSATVFDVYYPPPGIVEAKLKTNDTSVMGKLSFGKASVFFTGDVTDKVERQLAAAGFNLDSDILKVAHHGSRFSSAEEFLSAVSPAYAIIEVGKNNYGHPTEEAMGRIQGAKAEILRTDQNGTVRFVSDGINLYKK